MTFKERHKYLEESKIDPKVLKSLLIASGAGALGAGLDLYLSGHTDLQDFIKPMSAWGAAGAAGAVAGSEETKEEEIKK